MSGSCRGFVFRQRVDVLSLMALRFLTIVVCFASAVLTLEILWETPLGVNVNVNVRTAMGDISFFTTFYRTIVTASLIGSGGSSRPRPSRRASWRCSSSYRASSSSSPSS